LLRELTKKESKFQWVKKHNNCFKDLLQAFKDDALLCYFDTALNTYIFVEGHQTGLGAMLAQGTSLSDVSQWPSLPEARVQQSKTTHS